MSIIDLTAGAIEIGAIISVFLYGITTVQAYIFFRSSAEDSTKLKLLVLVVWLLESFLTILTCIYLYTITITSYGDAKAFNVMSWSMNLIPFVGGLVSAITQAFFSWRIYVISGHYPVSIILWAGSTLRVAITLTVSILGFKAKTISDFEARWGWTILLSFSVAMAVDLLNASALCYFLWRRPEVSPGTHHLIDKVMAWAIESRETRLGYGLTLAVISARIWICTGMVYFKVYSNAFLLS
ncbi:hypothetical protein B0H21DRAFT_709948 [Amylocystis lapponica]|nr:hypothetical protein B0H21DRAFT_709948 [Amylocystis lapponica]